MPIEAPATGGDWIALTVDPLPEAHAAHWAITPHAGAIVTFAGVVRDHAEGRDGVTSMTYEAYEEPARARMAEIAVEARRRWPGVERLALLHRLGTLVLSETSVVVVASAAHRGDAFDAARFCIDTLKSAVPIWKQEHWEGGDDWALGAHDLEPVAVDIDVDIDTDVVQAVAGDAGGH